MLLGLISDTHNRAERTARALQMLEQAGVEAILHCGDICDSHILALFIGKPLYYVMGNNDDDDELRFAATQQEDLHYLGQGGIITLAGKKLAVTHGHLHRVIAELLSKQPDYLFSGHTHVARNEMHHGVQCINPGALHRAGEYSIATLNVLTNDLRFLPVAS